MVDALTKPLIDPGLWPVGLTLVGAATRNGPRPRKGRGPLLAAVLVRPSMGYLWSWADVEAWAKATGRLPS